MKSPASQRRFGLDLLRAIAITFVLISHMANGCGWLGFLGVEIFFTLSGFLIGSILLRSMEQKRRFGFREYLDFLKRRWFRTLPNYYLFLLIFVGLQYLCPVDGTVATKDLPLYLMFMQSFAWPRPSFFGVSWSLCVEEWFYILLATGLLGLGPIFHRNAKSFLLSMLIVGATFVILPLILRTTFSWPISAEDQRMIVIYRLDAIMYGVLMACLKSGVHQLWAAKRHEFMGVGILLLMAGLLCFDHHSTTQFAILLSITPLSLGLALPLLDSFQPREELWARAVEKISIWSYSIYLSHIPIYLGLKQFIQYDQRSPIEKLTYKLFSLILIIVCSATIYFFYEKPLTDLRDRTRSPNHDHSNRSSNSG